MLSDEQLYRLLPDIATPKQAGYWAAQFSIVTIMLDGGHLSGNLNGQMIWRCRPLVILTGSLEI